MHSIRICEIEVVSGHFHILFDVDSVQQVSDFMEYAGSRLARARLLGKPLAGHWSAGRTNSRAAPGEDFGPLEYRDRVRGLVEEVEEEAAADRERSGIPVLGPGAILAQDRRSVMIQYATNKIYHDSDSGRKSRELLTPVIYPGPAVGAAFDMSLEAESG